MPTPKGGTDNTGAVDPETNSPAQPTHHMSARERALASMDEKILQQREADHAAALADGNPLAIAMENERRGNLEPDESFESQTSPRANVAAPRTRTLPEISGMDEGEDDPTPVTPVAAPTRAAKPVQPRAAAATGNGADPLADFLVVQDGKQMVRLKVDGKETLIPAEQARAQLQKFNAGDLRLQQATEARKQIERDSAALAVREAAVAARERTQPSATAAAEDQATLAVAKDLVKSLMSDTPDEAAAKMARVLANARRAPAVNVQAIVDQATVAAKQSIKAEETQKDVVSGFSEFQTNYPEIASDPNLFRYADNLSDVIKTEHPNWAPSKIMAEAGRQTRAWLETLEAPRPAAVVPAVPTVADTVSARQIAKDRIRPMPVVRAAARAAGGASQENVPAAPADVLAEIRRSRGQAA